MTSKFQILDKIGPMEKKLRDNQGKLRSFTDIMYEVYPSDVRQLVAKEFMKMLYDARKASYNSTDARDKVIGILILELVAQFCEAAEDLAAFGISFATEFYNDALPPGDVWTKLAEYASGDVVNFYNSIGKRGPEYFANLYGYPPIAKQGHETQTVLFSSCKHMAGYLSHVSAAYLDLRELQNAHKHGMRVFFGSRKNPITRVESPVLIYIDHKADVKAIEFPKESLEELYDLCVGIGQLLKGMLHWHNRRMHVTASHNLPLTDAPVFGMSSPREIKERILFPTLFELREYNLSKANQIASKKQKEISELRKGEIIAIDLDTEELIPCNTANVRDAMWKALMDRPTARLTLHRIHQDGKIGPLES